MKSVAAVGFWLLLFPIASLCWGQGSQADYDRMEQLGGMTRGKVYRTGLAFHWLPGGRHFWYRVQTGAATSEFVFVDLETGNREPAFDHQRVAAQLGELTGNEVVAEALPFSEIHFADDRNQIFFRFADRTLQIQRDDSTLSQLDDFDLPPSAAALTRIKPSVDKGDELDVEFANESDGEIRAIWIDLSGRRVPYGAIAQGESLRQHTFVGHVWLLVNADDEPLALFEVQPGMTSVRVDGKTKIQLDQRRRGGPRGRGGRGRGPVRRESPDGKYQAAIREGQLVVSEVETDAERLRGSIDDENQSFAEDRFYWSPDSRYLVALQVKQVEERKVYMIESSPKDQLQPKLQEMNYVKPGDEIRTERPRLFDVRENNEIALDESLFDNPWRLGDYRWRADSSEFCFLYNQRGHQVLRVIGISPESGRVRSIIEESAETFIDYTNKVFSHEIEATNEIIWMSERSGWNHLYLVDSATGEVKNAITSGEWVVRGIDRVDDESRQVWFRASGIVPGQDPYFVHHCRVDFDGSNLVMLTGGDGTHEIEYSPDGMYLIDTYSRVDQPETTCVRRVSDGSLVCTLEQGDCSELVASGWKPTIPFAAKGRDGQTDIYGVVYLPTTFDPDAKYPVIEYIYAGPHDSFVPKRFLTHNQARAMAELGFIVVQIDGMGTNNRGKAFHDVCWRNLGDSGFPDRILWMQAAAEQFPQMDLERVGIYGGSAGGQSALRALLAHGDFYKAAVSDCGCHDNRMDKIWWNEQWMGWPIGSHYEEQSNVTQAHQLQGDLLLIVGELDRNVDPASTMQVVDALIKADKDFDLLVVPGGGHGVGSGRYGMRRTRDFFVRHLHGVEPRGN